MWEGDRLAVEAAYGDAAGTALRWRRTYVPGPSGLDDPPQVVEEIFQPGSPFSGTARTYTYLRDELGTVVGLVAEDEGSDPQAPPVPVRYRYTPYGEAHAESGPELLRAHFDAEAVDVATTGGTVAQTVADPSLAAAGGLVVDWSLPLDAASFDSGLAVEELLPGSGWTAVDGTRLAVGEGPDEGVGIGDASGELRVVLTDGWQRGRSYRLRLTASLADRLGRPFGRSENLEWNVPARAAGADPDAPPPAVVYEQRFATVYESFTAAGDAAGGRFPGGQSRLFQGLWTDPVTGTSYARARWYDARNGVFLTEDPMDQLDSPNLYAFVGWQPSMATDPEGDIALIDNVIGGLVSVAVGVAVEAGINLITGDDNWDYSWKDAAIDFGVGFATSGLSSIGKVRQVAKLGRVGQFAVRAGAEIALDTGAEIARQEWKGEEYDAGDVLLGSVKNFAIGEAGSFVAKKVGVGRALARKSQSSRVRANIEASKTARRGSNFGKHAEFDKAFKLAGEVDVSTRHSRAVFYSGPGNRARALEFAERTGRTPIDFTPGGTFLESLDLYSKLPERQADLIWRRASERFARGASGEVNLFIKGARPDRLFRMIEEPILRESRDVYKWIFRGY